MKIKPILQFIIVFSLLLSISQAALGVNISTDSDVVFKGQAVLFTVVSEVKDAVPPNTSTITITFGDKTQPAIIQTQTNGVSTDTVSHSYSNLGSYKIEAVGVPGLNGALTAPATDSLNIIIIDPINQPDRGTVGEDYFFKIAATATSKQYQYKKVGGKLPPGLTLERNGHLKGIPTQKGSFKFTLEITTPRGTQLRTDLTVIIDPGPLVIKTTPETITVTRAGQTIKKVLFTVVQPTVPINETIRSNRGEFLLEGRLVGTFNRSLSINLNQATPSVSETITIPQSVLQAVQASGNNKVRYRRNFRPTNLKAGYSDTKVSIKTPAAGALRITKMRAYFEQNNRPIIMVERNERNLTGTIDIHYNGSGAFKGYWQVGGRIIERVQKNVFYGKVMTLKTPKTPPLPTYSEGTHRLQFIITEPASAQEKIDFPEAIYHVEAKKAEIVSPITLKTPENKSEFNGGNNFFTWSEVSGAQTYMVEFFEESSETSFFISYSKKEAYVLHPRLLNIKFTEGNVYEWQVKSFNKTGELNGESSRFIFTLSQQTTFVPGQVLFLVKNDAIGHALIRKIIVKYGLKVIETTELTALNQLMVTCSTDADIHDMMDQLQGENGIVSVQPNNIFSTLQNEDPLRSMQNINNLINLDQVHKRLTGMNILVAVIDTGVDVNHQDLKKRIKKHINFIEESEYTAEIHGTGVAGIIAGARNEFGVLGIAPNAKILALRACSQTNKSKSTGKCVSTSIAKAIDEAIRANADIANLSVGSSVEDQLIERMINAGTKSGLIFTAPVGNNPNAKKIFFPASHPKVTAVAGFDKAGKPLPNKELAILADAIAPGEDLFSATPQNSHNFLDGTSFSTAAITGLIALSLEAGESDLASKLPRFDTVNPWHNSVASFIGIEK